MTLPGYDVWKLQTPEEFYNIEDYYQTCIHCEESFHEDDLQWDMDKEPVCDGCLPKSMDLEDWMKFKNSSDNPRYDRNNDQ